MRVSFMSEISNKYGIEEAIVIDLLYNKMLKANCLQTGLRIMAKEMEEEIDCMSIRRIGFALKHLRDNGLIKVQKIKNVMKYTISDELLSECQNYYGSGMDHPQKDKENVQSKRR